MIYLWIVSFIWALSFGIIGSGLSELPASFIAMARMLLALIVFLPFLQKVPWRQALGLSFIGAIQFGAMYLFYTLAFKYLKSHEVALFTLLTPLYIILLIAIITKHLRRKTVLAVILVIIGAGVTVWQGLDGSLFWGFILVQLSNLSFAIGQVAYTQWQAPFLEHKDRNIFGYLYLGGLIATLPQGLQCFPEALHVITPTHIYILLYLGIIASGIAFFLWNYGARRVSSSQLALMNNLKLPLAAACSLFLFHEEGKPLVIILGSAIILVAFIVNRRTHRER